MRDALGKWLLGTWALLVLVLLSSLGVSHTVAMPEPTRGERLAQAMLALREQDPRPLFVHVLSGGCSCTERLLEHLRERGPRPEAREVILFVGDDPAKRAAAESAGFHYRSVSAGQLVERFHLDAAPVLLAFDAAGRMRYAGGYYSHPAAIFPQDHSIRAALAQGQEPQPLPVYGCAVNPRLQQSIDPLGVVYQRS